MQHGAEVKTRLRVALGTFVAIEAETLEDAPGSQAIDAAFAAVLKVQDLMHPTRGADLAALSACPAGTPLSVHPWTWEVLDLCRQLHRASHGAFDPCLDAADGRMTDLELKPGDIVIAHAPMRIDLGGIAKGYAVDRAIDALRAAQCIAGLVNAGGDLAVFGERSRQIACGGDANDCLLVELRDAALATSDARNESLAGSRPAEHRGYYDGRGRGATISGRATVIAGNAAMADGLTKCLLAAPRGCHSSLLEGFGARQLHYPPARTRARVRDRSV
jgi:thiamine biosynthesis lipoprotein